MSFPYADYDKWKTTLPEDDPMRQGGGHGKLQVAEYLYDENKLDAMLIAAGYDRERDGIIDVVDKFLARIEEVWRSSKDPKALRWANTMNVLRRQSLRNKR